MPDADAVSRYTGARAVAAEVRRNIMECVEKIGGATEAEIAYQTGYRLKDVEAICQILHEEGLIAARSWLTTDAAARVAESCKPGSLDEESGVQAITPQVPVEGGGGVTPHRAGRRQSSKPQRHRRGKLVA